MMNSSLQNTLDVMGVLAESERSIGRYYRCCAETWLEDEAFWLYLEGEENGHAKNLEEMAEMIRRNPDSFQMNRPFNIAAIRTFIAGTEQNIERLQKGALTRQKALVVARDIECAIIEKAYHEIVKTADLAYLSRIRQVVAETQFHKNAVEKKLRECVG